MDESPIVTVLIPLPLNYNPDKDGNRLPVEDEKFRVTATEIAERFREGGTLHRFRHDPPCGFWWDKGIVGEDVLALLEIDILDSQENRQ